MKLASVFIHNVYSCQCLHTVEMDIYQICRTSAVPYKYQAVDSLELGSGWGSVLRAKAR